ncbi:uncharacterized protein Hap1MRO34_000681 isoform 1-T2 [Clarias gariepinus]
MKLFHFCLSVWLIVLKDLHLSLSISVTFPNKEPLFIALGRTLVLEAQFQLQPSENILLRTWELKNDAGEVRVAEDLTGNNNRTTVEKNGALLRIREFKDVDFGIYKITVTTYNGDQVSDSREVIKISSPPRVYLSMQCNIQSVGTQWDSPVYSWQVDGVGVSNATMVSTDGSALLVKNLSGSYTCITESSQGRSEATVAVQGSDKSSHTGLIVVIVLEAIIIFVLTGLCCYMRRKSKSHANNTL